MVVAVELAETGFDGYLRGAELPVMVDFWASSCRPCSAVSPILEAIAREHEEESLLGKVNVGELPGLAARFGVESIPTMIVFRDSEPVTSIVGVMPKRYIETELGFNPNGAGRPDQRVSGLFEAKTERRAGFESGMFTTMSSWTSCLEQTRHRCASLPQWNYPLHSNHRSS
jgi:thioredoxin